jgi:hypothetical protein
MFADAITIRWGDYSELRDQIVSTFAPGGPAFKSRLGDRLSRIRPSVVFLSTSTHISGWNFDYVTTSFPISFTVNYASYQRLTSFLNKQFLQESFCTYIVSFDLMVS